MLDDAPFASRDLTPETIPADAWRCSRAGRESAGVTAALAAIEKSRDQSTLAKTHILSMLSDREVQEHLEDAVRRQGYKSLALGSAMHVADARPLLRSARIVKFSGPR